MSAQAADAIPSGRAVFMTFKRKPDCKPGNRSAVPAAAVGSQ